MNEATMRKHVEDALVVAREAANKEDARLGAEQTRGLDCGFAWVVCRPANSKLAKILKSYGADKHHAGGICFWNPSQHPTQSISTKEAGARAFSEHIKNTLQGEGYSTLTVGSRYD